MLSRNFLFFFITLSLYATAQNTDTLKTFTVTGNRIASSVMESGRNVQIISRAQIEALPVNNLNEALQYVAGLDFRQRGAFGAQADVSLRGGTFDQTLILVNGIKVTDPQTGHHNMNLGIDLQAIKQIEVIKGPAAARYGLNTFSGVINIITEPADEAKWTITSNVAQDAVAPSVDPFYGGYELNTTAHLGSKRSRHLVSLGRLQSTGYRPNTDLNRNSVFYQGETDTKWGTFKAMGSAVQNAFGASGFYAFPIDSSSEEEVTTYVAALEHAFTIDHFRFTSRIYSRKNFDTYTLFRENPQVFQNRHRTDVEGGELHAAYAYGIGTLGLGLEYRREAINSSNLGQWTRDNGGVFIENRLYLLQQRLALNTGAYLNVSSDYGTQLLPSIEASYKLTDQWSLFGNAGQSFRVPTFTDLYYVGPTNIGNPDLQPEESNQIEAGVKWGRNGQLLQASYFLQEASGLIDWVRSTELDPWTPENYEVVITNGLDLNYTWMPQAASTEGIHLQQLRLGYTYLDMQQQSIDARLSRYALNNLRHQLTLNGAMAFGEHWSLSLHARYLDRMAYQDYWLMDARLQCTQDRFEWWLDVTNLLDTDYIEAANAPMPGRWLRTGLMVRLR